MHHCIIGNDDVEIIQQAFYEYHKNTCIKFIPRRSTDSNYISIKNDQTGCWSSVGRIGGRQDVNFMSPDCLETVGTVIHELMHAVGFMHEQNREDRDDYVTINFNNLEPGKEKNFGKARTGQTTAFGVGYDYGR